MVSKRDEKYVVYPCYFDSLSPRPRRRIPKELAVRGPSVDEVAKAALALKLSPVLEKGRSHPAKPWEKSGRVLVNMRGEKGALLRQLAEKLREQRGQSATPVPRKA
jgi:signal recognition particle subunit SRP19